MTNSMIASKETQIWKYLFIGLSVLTFIIMPICSLPHGMSGDEWTLIIYGNDIYDYFFNGSKVAIDYDIQKFNQVKGLHYYGGLYDFVVTFLHKTFFSSANELTFRHIINSLVGAALFLYTGLLAKEIGGWRTAVIALLLIVLSPRLFGESMNNPKDIPFAFANVFFIYYLIRFTKHLSGSNKAQWKYALLMGLGFGLAIGFRIGGIILLPFTLVYLGLLFLSQKEVKALLLKNSKSIALKLAVAVILGYIIGIMFWPWALQEPLSRPFEALVEMTNRAIPIRMLYDGEYIMNTNVPNSYTFNWIFISSPIIVIILYIMSGIFSIPLAKKYSFTNIFFLHFLFFFPIFYAVYKHSVLYDSWRHFFFTYPYIVILAALLVDYLMMLFEQKAIIKWGILAIVLIGCSLPLKWIIENAPNEYVYFNEFNGGIKNALGKYDLDYYQNSGKQGAEWVMKNAKSKDGKPILVASNMAVIGKYFSDDTAKFKGTYVKYTKRDIEDWDYYICYSRYLSVYQLTNNTWPPKNAAHVITAGGVPIAAVFERKSKYDYLGYQALESGRLQEAADYYQKAYHADSFNTGAIYMYALFVAQSGSIEGAFQLLDRAKKIDAEDPGIYNTEKQIYKALGQLDRAEESDRKIQEILSRNKSTLKHMLD